MSANSAGPDAQSAAPEHDPYSAWRSPVYRRYLAGNLISLLGMQMQATAIGWEIYERTHDARQLALVGLIQFLPVLLLSIPAGQIADIFPRKRVVLCCLALLTLGSAGLTAASLFEAPVIWLYACLTINGVAKAVQQPSKAAMLPLIVAPEQFPNAVTWNGGTFQIAAVAGPAIAGGILAWTRLPGVVYAVEASASLLFFGLLLTVPLRTQETSLRRGVSLLDFGAGLQFVWRTKIILGALALDMFAVLLGGATALLPVYAEDILDVGAEGLGWMRAAPAVGALGMSFVLAHRPPLQQAGRALLWSVAGFGVATIAFGVSRSFWMSCVWLLLTGAFDMISVIIRHTLVQTLTPDAMRGRVSAVNGVFIGASNELGAVESGMVAAWCARENDPEFGPTVSVVTGGLGTLLVVAFVGWRWPAIRRYGPLGPKL